MPYNEFINENIAPYSATKIGVYDSDGNKVGIIPLGDFKPDYGTRLYRFGLLSDVHNQSDQTSENTEDLQRALTYFNEKQSVVMTCICGDISQNGTAEEFAIYQNNVNTCSPNTPVYTTTGNHDCPFSGNFDNNTWQTYTGNSNTFEITYNNDHFLFFGMSLYSLGTSTSTPYSTTDIDWLEEKLEEYKNERCFVFTHLFFPTRAGNLNNIYPSDNWLAGDQLTRIQALNDRYLNSIWFSGHSHWKWYLQKYQERANIYKENCGWCVHVPSCASPIDSDGSSRVSMPLESEGAIVDVYDTYIDIRGMDLKNGLYLPIAQYRLDTTLVEIASTYIITNNLTNATNSNSATSIGEGQSYTATITANAGYTLSTITVTMGGIDITSTALTGNVITINSVTGNISIEANATLSATGDSVTVSNNLYQVTSSNSATVATEGSTFTTTLIADGNCTLNHVRVTMDGTDVTDTVYTADTGVINIGNVTGNITINALAITTSQNVYDVNASHFSIQSGAPTIITNADGSITITLNSTGVGFYVSPTEFPANTTSVLYLEDLSYSSDLTDEAKRQVGFAISGGYTMIPGNRLTASDSSRRVRCRASSGYSGDIPISITFRNCKLITG